MYCSKYTFYEDPGHGWLEVPLHECRALGIADKISGCSYIRIKDGCAWLYLEEDCDAPLYLDAYRKKYGREREYITQYRKNIFIRNLGHYEPRFKDVVSY